MALSFPDVDPNMRGPIAPETRPSLPSVGVIFVKNPSLLQAFNMGSLIGGITSDEASRYKDLREAPGSLKSDQVLMAEDVLTGARSEEFKNALPQIFRPH